MSGPQRTCGSCREANLGALSARLPELALLMRATLDEGAAPLTLAATPGGETSARLPSGLWLHSPRAPREEARRLVAASLDPAADIVILLGFGIGYVAEACLEAGVEQVIVCEADQALLAAALDSRDLTAMFADERLGFVVGGDPEAVLSALETSGAVRAAILGLRAAELGNPAWYSRAREAAERWNAKNAANENTLRKFGRLWVRNLARNRKTVAVSAGVRDLQQLFAGLPAIVLAAGPSLDRVLPHLRGIAQRAVVICVDTALRSLQTVGLEPDFLVVVDPQYWNWRHIAGLGVPQAVLISESAAWPPVFRTPCRRLFLGGSLFPLGRRIEGLAGTKGQLGAGGSVATSAWDLARLLGCDSVWMAGLDLGFPRGATHARASFFEQRALAGGLRLRPAESEQVAAVYGLRGSQAPAMGGGTVRTDPRMSLYAWWFEARLARPQAPTTLSLCPEGLAVPGMRLGTIEELLRSPPCREAIESRMLRIDDLPAPSREETLELASLRQLLAELEEIAAAAERALEAAGRARSALDTRVAADAYLAADQRAAANADAAADSAVSAAADAAAQAQAEVERSLAALDAADRAIAGCAAKDLTAFLMPPLVELLSRRAKSLVENIGQSESIYRSVAESARYHIEVLARD